LDVPVAKELVRLDTGPLHHLADFTETNGRKLAAKWAGLLLKVYGQQATEALPLITDDQLNIE
jgi:hypothetical protein